MVEKQLSKLDIESFITDGDGHPHYDHNGQLQAQTTYLQEKQSVDGPTPTVLMRGSWRTKGSSVFVRLTHPPHTHG